MCSSHRDRFFATVFVALGTAFLLPAGAAAHPGQHVDLRISIIDEEVVYEMLLSSDFLNAVLPARRDELKLTLEQNVFRFLDPQQEQRERQAVAALFKDANPLAVDGVRVRPILRQMQFVPAADPLSYAVSTQLPPDLRVVLAYPAKGRPKQVAMAWDVYARPGSGVPGLESIFAELDAYDENTIVSFTRREPEVVWHAPGKPVRQRVMPVVATAEPTGVAVPLVSVGAVILWGVCLTLLRVSPRWRSARRAALVLTVVPVAIAVYCHDVLTVRVATPWGRNVRAPGAAAAADIFTSLHRNVYRAFDYKTESDVYDVLAQSVAGDLLDQVYNEVYQSLILRDQGGAVARVQSVDVLETELLSSGALPGSGAPAFQMQSRWRVRGAVVHWGHMHSRTNEYRARYVVAQLGSNWKITGVAVLEQRRIIFDDDDPPIESLPRLGESQP